MSKGGVDLVTAVDQASEKLILDFLTERYFVVLPSCVELVCCCCCPMMPDLVDAAVMSASTTYVQIRTHIVYTSRLIYIYIYSEGCTLTLSPHTPHHQVS